MTRNLFFRKAQGDIKNNPKAKLKLVSTKSGDMVHRWVVTSENAVETSGINSGVFATGVPVSFKHQHSTWSAKKNLPAEYLKQFGGHIEPSGKYVTEREIESEPSENMEHGETHFKNPLVVEWNGYGEDGWKQRLSEHYGGKKGKALSTAVAKDGFDGIVTVDNGHTTEIVDLTHLSYLNPKKKELEGLSDNGKQFKNSLKDKFDLSEDESEAVAIITDARAKSWSSQNGKHPNEWYNSHLASIEKNEVNSMNADEVLERLANTGLVSNDDIVKILGDERPKYLDGVIDFLLEQRQKLVSGNVTARDVAKAYYMTVASQGTDSMRVESIEKKTGFKFDLNQTSVTYTKNGEALVRPEEAAAQWLMSSEGKEALDAIEKGEFRKDLWTKGAEIRHAFGDDRFKTIKVLEPLNTENFNLTNLKGLVEMINNAKGDPTKIGNALRMLNGVGDGKIGFVKHFLGLGDTPTIDAVEINAWITGAGDISHMDDVRSNLARDIKLMSARKRVMSVMAARIQERFSQLRQSGVGKDIPPEIYSHVLHHWLWDKAKNTQTSHSGLYHAMRFAQMRSKLVKADVEFLKDGRAIIRAVSNPDVSSAIHEMAHVFRRDLNGDDLKIAEEWAGVIGGKWKREHEEKFAVGFEHYVMKGESPSPHMESVFSKMKNWMVGVYSRCRVKPDRIHISPEMKGVFDRLLTTENKSGRNAGIKIEKSTRIVRTAKSQQYGNDGSSNNGSNPMLRTNIFEENSSPKKRLVLKAVAKPAPLPDFKISAPKTPRKVDVHHASGKVSQAIRWMNSFDARNIVASHHQSATTANLSLPTAIRGLVPGQIVTAPMPDGTSAKGFWIGATTGKAPKVSIYAPSHGMVVTADPSHLSKIKPVKGKSNMEFNDKEARESKPKKGTHVLVDAGTYVSEKSTNRKNKVAVKEKVTYKRAFRGVLEDDASGSKKNVKVKIEGEKSFEASHYITVPVSAVKPAIPKDWRYKVSKVDATGKKFPPIASVVKKTTPFQNVIADRALLTEDERSAITAKDEAYLQGQIDYNKGKITRFDYFLKVARRRAYYCGVNPEDTLDVESIALQAALKTITIWNDPKHGNSMRESFKDYLQRIGKDSTGMSNEELRDRKVAAAVDQAVVKAIDAMMMNMGFTPSVTQDMNRVNQAIAQLKYETGREPSDEQVARRLSHFNMKRTETGDTLAWSTNRVAGFRSLWQITRTPRSIDEPLNPSEPQGSTVGEAVIGADSAMDVSERRNSREDLMSLLKDNIFPKAHLTAEEQSVLLFSIDYEMIAPKADTEGEFVIRKQRATACVKMMKEVFDEKYDINKLRTDYKNGMQKLAAWGHDEKNSVYIIPARMIISAMNKHGYGGKGAGENVTKSIIAKSIVGEGESIRIQGAQNVRLIFKGIKK